MSKDPIFDAKGKLLSSGVFPDFESQSPPLIRDARNYLFAANRVQTFLGGEALFSTGVAVQILGVEAIEVGGAANVFFGTETELRQWNGATVTVEGSGYTGNEDQTATSLACRWDIVPWGAWVLANNGFDRLQVWKGASFAGIADFNTEIGTAYIALRYKEFLQVFNLAGSGGHVEGAWCKTDDPETWTPTAANLAGRIIFRGLESGIRAAKKMADFTAVYSSDSMHGMFFTQQQTVFGQQHLLKGIGAFGKMAVDSIGGLHRGFGPRGLWQSDGNSYQYIHDPAVKRYIYNNINLDQASKCIVSYDNQIQATLFMWPSLNSDDVDQGIALNHQDNSWSPFDIDATCVSTSGVYHFPLIGTSAGSIIKQSIYDVGLVADEDDGVFELPTPSASVSAGYGSGGYGQGGYGGLLHDGDG